MNILVLENDPRELALIQQALNSERNALTPLTSSEQVWPLIQSGDFNFLIANWDTSDLGSTQFIPRIRAAKLPKPLYILLTTSKSSEDSLIPSDVDDTIQRPFKPQDLKNRVAMAERITSLANNLATARSQLDKMAMFDNLTGFMNRTAFLRQSTGELQRARRASLPLSLIALEIDNFNTINESFGMQFGDEVLHMVAQVIREKSRPYDWIGRWAGDQFTILFTGVIGADAEKIAERIIAGVHATRIQVKEDAPLDIKMSAGIASATRIGTSTEIEPVIQQALQAMKRASESGGNQVFLIYI